MGLDMYFFDEDSNEIYYYRKHHELNDLIIGTQLNNENNEYDAIKSLNCCDIVITKYILDKIIEKANNINEYNNYYRDKWKDTKNNLIPLLEEYISNGRKVVYFPYW